MCWPTGFDMHLCERIIDSDNNVSAPGRMSIVAKKECWRVRCIFYVSERRSPFPSRLELKWPQRMFHLKASRLKNNGVCWKHATALHTWRPRGKILTSHVAQSALITFQLSTFFFVRQLDGRAAFLNRQIKNTMPRSSFIYLNCLSNKFYSPFFSVSHR